MIQAKTPSPRSGIYKQKPFIEGLLNRLPPKVACHPVVDQDGVGKVDAGIGILQVVRARLLVLCTKHEIKGPATLTSHKSKCDQPYASRLWDR